MDAVKRFEQSQKQSQLPNVRSGDVVRVHQRITEGSKQRTQAFEGVVIRTQKMDSLAAAITVRRIASGIGVEKTFKLHAPNIEKVEPLKRSKVRRNYLSYLRRRQGKAARLHEIGFKSRDVKAQDMQASQDVAEADTASVTSASESDR